MAVRYADEVRKDRKSSEHKLKYLSTSWAQKQKKLITTTGLLRNITILGQRGNYHLLPASLRQQIVALHAEIESLAQEISKEDKYFTVLNKELTTAPKRPKTRSPFASIAASGTRAINDKARQFDRQSLWTSWKSGRERGTPEELLWSAGMAAARKTAAKCGGLDGAVPQPAQTIMRRALEKNLKKRKLVSRLQYT